MKKIIENEILNRDYKYYIDGDEYSENEFDEILRECCTNDADDIEIFMSFDEYMDISDYEFIREFGDSIK